MTARIDITVYEEAVGAPVSYSHEDVVEFELTDTLVVYTGDDELEYALDDLEHLAVSTPEGSGIHWSGFLERHVENREYTRASGDGDGDRREVE
ncbi:MAG: hypothetical protein ABEJ34_00690 [Haloferacaceae archaeon]